MFEHPIARDLALLTAAKLAVIAVIYFAFFAAYDGRPVDMARHLLGPAAPAQAQSQDQSANKGP